MKVIKSFNNGITIIKKINIKDEISGIYLLKVIINNKNETYVGCSKDIKKRLYTHSRNIKFQSIKYKILFECEESILLKAETYFIHKLKPSLNKSFSFKKENIAYDFKNVKEFINFETDIFTSVIERKEQLERDKVIETYRTTHIKDWLKLLI